MILFKSVFEFSIISFIIIIQGIKGESAEKIFESTFEFLQIAAAKWQCVRAEKNAALEIKNKIHNLQNYYSKSAVVSPTIHNVDVITLKEDDKSAFVNYLKINNGAIIHGHTVEVKKKLIFL